MSSRRPKGTGSIRRRDSRWEAAYSYQDGRGQRKRRSRRFASKREAQAWLIAEQATVAAGTITDPRQVTVAKWLTAWLGSAAVTTLEANTRSWYRSAVESHLIPAIGSVKLSALTAVLLEGMYAEKAANGRLDGRGGLGASSLRRLHVTMHKALDAAVRDGLLARNPAAVATPPRVRTGDPAATCWTPEHLSAFLEFASTDRLAALWRTVCWTGLRRSELCGLQWADVDLDRAMLSVRRAVVVVDGHPIIKGPKTARSRRVVELDRDTVAVLRTHRKQQVAERLRAATLWDPTGWIFCNEVGEVLNPDRVYRRFRRLVTAAELPPTPFHGIRHAHATALLKAGVPAKIVGERLGHSSIAVTLDIYTSVLPGMQREAVERLAATMGATSA